MSTFKQDSETTARREEIFKELAKHVADKLFHIADIVAAGKVIRYNGMEDSLETNVDLRLSDGSTLSVRVVRWNPDGESLPGSSLGSRNA